MVNGKKITITDFSSISYNLQFKRVLRLQFITNNSQLFSMLFEKQLSELESYLPQMDKTNPSVSKSDVGWQIDHALRVLRGISWQLEESNPDEFRQKFNIKRKLFLMVGIIRRGTARVPKSVVNDKEVTEESIRSFLEKTKEQVKKIDALPAKSFFIHPYLGFFDKKESIRFIEIHTEHHLKIIRDMLR